MRDAQRDYTKHDADTENLRRRRGKLPTSKRAWPMTPLLTKEQQAKLDAWYANEKTMWPDGLVPWETYQAKMMQLTNS